MLLIFIVNLSDSLRRWFIEAFTLLILDAHCHEILLDCLFEPAFVFLRFDDGWLVALPEFLETRLKHFFQSVVLNVVDNRKSKFFGPGVDDHKQAVVNDLALSKAKSIVVHTYVQDFVHIVAHS